MPDAAARFSAIAGTYDAARPQPPGELADLIMAWGGIERPHVVDLGAGTGLSAVIWAGQAPRVTAVEPSGQMRALALRRMSAAAGPAPGASAVLRTEFTAVAATAEDTGLPSCCADVVTASQALHWFDPARALPEIARILRPGGVFAAYDCDWPPCIDAETGAAYTAMERRRAELDAAHGRPPYAAKESHGERLAASGLFREVIQVALHSRDEGDAGRLIRVALSQGGVAGLLNAGVSEDDLRLTALREVAARPRPRPWWWTYRVHLAIR